MRFLVVQQTEPSEYRYAEMNEHGDVRDYPSREVAEARAKELGGLVNGYRAANEEDAATLTQYGARYKVQHS